MTFRPVALAALFSLASVLPSQAGVIRGTVRESKDGPVIPGARAYSFLPGQENAVQTQAQADQNGVFFLTNVPAGVLTVRVSAPWHDAWSGSVSMGGDADTEKVEAYLTRQAIPGAISGVITFEGGTKPGRHAHVHVKGSVLETTADELGQFTLFGVQVGPQTIEFVALGFDMVTEPVLLEEGRNTVMHVDLGHSLAAGGSGPKPTTMASISDTVGCVRFTVQDTSKVPSRMSSMAERHVTVEILSGDRVVRKLMDWSTIPGPYTVAWDGRDDSGKFVASGNYSYRAKVDQDPPFEGQFVKH
jgi:hypothetical protein